MQETREHIKSRMLKHVARLWGYTETEAESSFDPLVSMLLGACASELEKLSSEIHASRARVMERLVQLLSPDTLTGALPAHAIASALPVEPTTELKPDMQFYCRLKQGVSQETQEAYTKDLFFSPTDHFHLNRASVRFMATGGQMFKVFGNQKEVMASTNANWPASTLWLGIDEPEVSLHQTLFYFDFRNETDKQLFYHQLPKAKWFYQHVPLKHIPGYGDRDICGETFEVNSVRAGEFSMFHKIRKQVNAFYKPYFITLEDNEGITVEKGSDSMPSFIADSFKTKDLDLIRKQPLRWIRILFPETISNRLLLDMVCTMNCFPVANRRIHEVNYRLQELINVIPLHADDIFLDLEEVSTDENKPMAVHSYQQDSQESFAMLMRNGGIGRFDERDAAAMIDYLLQLLRDESAAFSILDNDFVSSEIKQLQQVMNKLEQRLFSRQIHRGSCPYLVIHHNQKSPKQSLFIKYCSTNGQEANNLKTGTRLHPYNGSAIISNSVFLVSPSRGGRDKLATTESVLAYKSALLSKDRLITAEDIKAFCYYQLGDRVENIAIQKSMMINPDERQGYMRTIDVVLYLHENAYEDMLERELGFWEEHLTHLLEEKSVAWVPYRVITKKAL